MRSASAGVPGHSLSSLEVLRSTESCTLRSRFALPGLPPMRRRSHQIDEERIANNNPFVPRERRLRCRTRLLQQHRKVSQSEPGRVACLDQGRTSTDGGVMLLKAVDVELRLTGHLVTGPVSDRADPSRDLVMITSGNRYSLVPVVYTHHTDGLGHRHHEECGLGAADTTLPGQDSVLDDCTCYCMHLAALSAEEANIGSTCTARKNDVRREHDRVAGF